MEETLTLVQILTEIAPLVLVALILSAVLILFLWVIIKILVPTLHELNINAQKQRETWQAIIEEQNQLTIRQVKELRSDMERDQKHIRELEGRVSELTDLLKAKDQEIKTLQGQIVTLREDNKALKDEMTAIRAEDEEKAKQIKSLEEQLDEVRSDREKVARERDELLEEVKALRKEVQALKAKGEKTE